MSDPLRHFEHTVAASAFVTGAMVGVLVIEVSFWLFGLLILVAAGVSLWNYWRLP